jgi:hypothetical protein
VYFFEGNANVFMREFEKGIVVVNATPTSRTVDLGGTFLRIRGTGQDPINDGSSVSRVTVAPYDAAILVRRANEHVSAGSGGSTGSSIGSSTDDGETDTGVSGGGSTGGGSAGSCGAPALSSSDPTTIFVWEDTCVADQWQVRTLSNSGWKTFGGSLSVVGGFSGLQGVELESHDSLSANGNEIAFVLKAGSGVDGFRFKAPGSGEICLTLDDGTSAQVRLGGGAQSASTPVNVRTGAGCGQAQSLSYGEPDYGSMSRVATYLWQDEATGRWSLRVTAGGSDQGQSFTGRVYKAAISNLKRVSLEGKDSVTQTSSTNVNYDLGVIGIWEDGFDFNAASGACVAFGGDAYIGKSMAKVTSPLNLTTLGSCN